MVCRGGGELSTLGELIGSLARSGGAWTVEVPPDWMQGRTLYGGLGAALAVETARRAVPGLPPLRAAQFAFVGPAAGRISLEPTVVRAGKSVTFLSVDLSGGAGIATRAMLCFGAARASALSHTALPMPAVAGPDECPPLSELEGAPAFLQHFDARLTGGARFGGRHAAAEITAWFRHRDERGVDETVALIALGDASPPAPLAMVERMVPVSTMMWSVELGAAPAHGWRLVRLVGEMIADGYAAERITIWDEQGVPLLTARQSIAVFA